VHPAAGVALEDQVAGTRVIDHPSIDRSIDARGVNEAVDRSTRAGSTKPLIDRRARGQRSR
jgi:hypothetical protein